MPLVIDLFCGLGGWSEGFLAEGWRCAGFDIERHDYGTGGYPGQLVLQDVLTLHGSQFRDADCIVASPPCQEFSFMAMPWSRAKQIAAALRGEGVFPAGYHGSRTVQELTALFDACFRIQREACEAASRHIPMVVENVKGAQPWVGPAKANYGSFYLWGDIGMANGHIVIDGARFGQFLKAPGRAGGKFNPDGTQYPQGSWFAVADSKNRGANKNGDSGGSWFAIGSPGQTKTGQNPDGRKVPGMNFHEYEKTGQPGRSFQSAAVAQKQPIWFNDDKRRAVKCGGDWFGSGSDRSLMRSMSSKSSARKAASAQIAKIPRELAQWVARAYKPKESGYNLNSGGSNAIHRTADALPAFGGIAVVGGQKGQVEARAACGPVYWP